MERTTAHQMVLTMVLTMAVSWVPTMGHHSVSTMVIQKAFQMGESSECSRAQLTASERALTTGYQRVMPKACLMD